MPVRKLTPRFRISGADKLAAHLRTAIHLLENDARFGEKKSKLAAIKLIGKVEKELDKGEGA